MDGLDEAVEYCSNHEEQIDWCNDVVLNAFWDEYARLQIDFIGSGVHEYLLDKYYDDLGQKRKKKVDEKEKKAEKAEKTIEDAEESIEKAEEAIEDAENAIEDEILDRAADRHDKLSK